MCLIIVKEPGIGMPTEKFISDVWDTNPHGGGLLYQREGDKTIMMKKGFMKLSEYLQYIESLEIKESDYVALHLRFATSGKTNKITSHPFVVHKQKEVRNIISCESDKHLFMMHNGQICDLDNGKKMSDTQKFARDYMPHINPHQLYNNEVIQEMIEKFIDGSRLLFAHGVHGFLRLGDWVEGENGLLLSKKFSCKTLTPYSRNWNNNWSNNYSKGESQTTLWEDEPDEGQCLCGWCGNYNYESDMFWSDDWQYYVCTSCNEDHSLGYEKEVIVDCKCGNWEIILTDQEKIDPYKFSFVSSKGSKHYYKCKECNQYSSANFS